MITIGEVVQKVATWNPAKSGSRDPFPYIDLSSVDQGSKRITAARSTAPAEAPSRARQLVRLGDVLVSTVRPNLNAVAYVDRQFDGATASTGFAVLRPTDRIDGRYLFHWARSPLFVDDMVRKATGASYPAVSDKIVKESSLLLPPIEEQRRIAAILDHADNLRKQQRAWSAYLADLKSSLFEAFMAESATRSVTFGDLAERITVGVVVRPASHYVPDGVPALRTLNVRPGRIDLRDLVYFSPASNEGPLAKSRLRAGDIVIARTGKPGTSAIVPVELDGANAIDLIIMSVAADQALPEFVCGLLNSNIGKRLVAGEQRGQIQQHVNVGSLRSAPLPLPSLEAQRVLTDQISSLNEAMRKAEHRALEVEALVDSLQARAFSGRL